ncbi:hypothetical protein FRC12_008652 [Ceratobasidium sp. 428]|nr:hypothetical protein FRC12_008652 [Ceratobasidium sp. 428]
MARKGKGVMAALGSLAGIPALHATTPKFRMMSRDEVSQRIQSVSLASQVQGAENYLYTPPPLLLIESESHGDTLPEASVVNTHQLGLGCTRSPAAKNTVGSRSVLFFAGWPGLRCVWFGLA